MRCHHACRSQICPGQPFPDWCWRVVCSPCSRALRRRMLFHLSNLFHLTSLHPSTPSSPVRPIPALPQLRFLATPTGSLRPGLVRDSYRVRERGSLRFAGWRTGQLEVSSHRARGASPAHRSLARSLSFCVFGLCVMAMASTPHLLQYSHISHSLFSLTPFCQFTNFILSISTANRVHLSSTVLWQGLAKKRLLYNRLAY
ncbi:hypothetical protein IWZ00DRAFT_72030 [Phyllosticta capitalensis]